MGLLWGNDTKTCPKCGMTIPSQAEICPFCHSEQSTGFFADLNSMGCLGLPLCMGIVFFAVIGISKCSESDMQQRAEQTNVVEQPSLGSSHFQNTFERRADNKDVEAPTLGETPQQNVSEPAAARYTISGVLAGDDISGDIQINHEKGTVYGTLIDISDYSYTLEGYRSEDGLYHINVWNDLTRQRDGTLTGGIYPQEQLFSGEYEPEEGALCLFHWTLEAE